MRLRHVTLFFLVSQLAPVVIGCSEIVDSRAAGVGTNGGSTLPGNVDGGSPTVPGESTAALSDLPCDVGMIVRSRCGDCHGTTPKFGAPMSLARSADFGKPAQDRSKTVRQVALARIADDVRPMPQAPAPRLTASESGVLQGWINAGAKPSSCQNITNNPATTTITGDNPDGGGPTTGGDADPTVVADADVTCYELRAHDPSGKKTAFKVPAKPDLYHCFSFAPPWGSDKVQMVDWKPVIDNDKVIHHWILYNDAGAVTDGADVDCSVAHPSAQMVTGWAPGGDSIPLPKDVGQDVSGKGFTLEIHYNNTASTAQPDSSGVSLCVTKKLRPNEAGIHWLGTENISLPSGGKTSGVCTPTTTKPVTIISSTPHMHLQGRHQSTVIKRANGSTEVLLDKPFDFESQVTYRTPQVINPGDSLTTTCEYEGAAFYGQGTKQEMCYNFVLAYPNGGLSSGSFLRKNGCTGL